MGEEGWGKGRQCEVRGVVMRCCVNMRCHVNYDSYCLIKMILHRITVKIETK